MSRLGDINDVAGPSGSLSSVIQRKKQDSGQSSAISAKSSGSKSSGCGSKSVVKKPSPSKGAHPKVLAVVQVAVLPRPKGRRILREVMMMILMGYINRRKSPKTNGNSVLL